MLIKNARNSKSGREIKDVNSQINIFLKGPTSELRPRSLYTRSY